MRSSSSASQWWRPRTLPRRGRFLCLVSPSELVIKSLAVAAAVAERIASPVCIGVIGGGLVAQVVHLPLLQRLDEHFRLVALAEPDEDLRRRLGSRHAM